MFTDISVSTDLNNKFNSFLKDTCGEIGKSDAIRQSHFVFDWNIPLFFGN